MSSRAVAASTAEERGQEQPLGHGGVLVLVEQDDPELVAQEGADLGPGQGELGGEGDLVAEVEEVPASLGRPVAPGQSEEFAAGPGRLGDLAQLGVGEPGRLQSPQEFRVVLQELLGAYEVLGELRVQGEQVADEGGEGPGQRRVGARRLAQHPGRELVAGGVREETAGGFEADPQTVVGEEPRLKAWYVEMLGSPGGCPGRGRPGR